MFPPIYFILIFVYSTNFEDAGRLAIEAVDISCRDVSGFSCAQLCYVNTETIWKNTEEMRTIARNRCRCDELD